MGMLRELLEHWGWSTPASDSRWCSVRCGNPEHDDRRASARVYINEGAYMCLGCGIKASSPARLVMVVKNVTWREANEYVAGLGGETGTGVGLGKTMAGRTWTAHRGKRFAPARARLRRVGGANT